MSEGTTGAVAAGHPREAEAALRILAEGGNAVDAAIAGAFVAMVVEPNNAGPAGYGHLTAWLPQSKTFLTVDHGPRAPQAAHPELFTLAGEHPSSWYEWPAVEGRANELGALAAAAPGAVSGLCAAHERGGRLPLEQLLQPAIELADAGLPIDWHVSLTVVQRLADIRSQPAAAAHLLRDGDPPSALDDWGHGDRLDTSALAETLRRVAREGASGFHEGPVAEAIVRAVADGGGILTTEDLASYRPRVVEERPTSYRGRLVTTAEDDLGHLILGILSHFDLPALEPGSVDALHLMAETFGHAFADVAAYGGDAGVVPEISNALRGQAYAAQRAAAISPERAASRPLKAGTLAVGDAVPGVGGSRVTTQIVVADGEGGMAVVITTIGQDFGGLTWVPEAGVLLNSAMANFDPRPGRINSIEPGRMPLFGVPAAIVVEDGRAVLACGGSGGYRITSSVVHTIVNVLDHGLDAAAAVAAPRIWCQGEETYVDARVDPAVRDALVRRGHQLVAQNLTPAWEPFARVSVVIAGSDGGLDAASDPVWHGASGVLAGGPGSAAHMGHRC